MSNRHSILQALWTHSFNIGFSPSQCTEACKKGGSIECDTNSGSCQCMKTSNCDPNNPVCYKCSADLCNSLAGKCGSYTPPVDSGLNNYCDARNTICGTRTGNCDIYAHPELVDQCVTNGGNKSDCTMYMDRDGDSELAGQGSICSGGDHPDPDAPGGWTTEHKQDLHESIARSSPPGTKNVDAIANCVVNIMVNSGYTYAQVNDAKDPAVQALITKSLSGCIQHNGGGGVGSSPGWTDAQTAALAAYAITPKVGVNTAGASCFVKNVQEKYSFDKFSSLSDQAEATFLKPIISNCNANPVWDGHYSRGLSTGAIIGIIAGSVVFLLAIFLLLRSRKKRG